MKKTYLIIVILTTLVFSAVACSTQNGDNTSTDNSSNEENEDSSIEENAQLLSDISALELSTLLIEEILAGDFSRLYDISSDTVKKSITKLQLESAWQSTTLGKGAFLRKESPEQTLGTMTVVKEFLVFEKTGIQVTFTFSDTNALEGIYFSYFTPDEFFSVELPNALSETPYTVITGDFELPALLTTKDGNSKENALLLVHGSGPNDMDESIGGAKVFRDIAWNVALEGIDVFRYDKRTFVYQKNLAKPDDRYLTVEEEVIQDVLSAAKLLSDQGYENIYLLGHSLGGMLGPRIITQEPKLFAGFISLAGTPRTLSEVQIDQIRTQPSYETQKIQLEEFIEDETKKLEEINNFTENELISKTIFGFQAYYIKDINSYDATELAKNLDIPMIFMQGSEDFQVTVEKDFNLWQEGLKDKENVSFKLYDGLTHLFTPAPENPTGTVNDYMLKANVHEDVINDIIDFIYE